MISLLRIIHSSQLVNFYTTSYFKVGSGKGIPILERCPISLVMGNLYLTNIGFVQIRETRLRCLILC